MSTLFILFLGIVHSFHISVTELNYKETSGNMEITMMVFADDLEDAVNRKYGDGTLNIFQDAQSLKLKKYIESKIFFENKGIKRIPNFLGYELEGNRCLIFLEMNMDKEQSYFTFHNSILLDIFSDQKNMVHFIQKKNKSTLIINQDKPYISYSRKEINNLFEPSN